MKVLIIHNILWAHYKSVLFEAMHKFKSKEIDFRVVHIATNEVSRKNMGSETNDYKYPYDVLFDNFIENISIFRKTLALFKYIISFKPDVINFTGYGVDTSITLSIFLAKLLGKKIIISVESTYVDHQRSFYKEKFKSIIIKFSDGFITFGTNSTKYLLNLGAKEYQIIENKAAVVDDIKIKQIFNSSKNINSSKYITKYNFLFVGRLIDVKNLESLVSAFGKLKKQNLFLKDWGLIILGDGPQKNILEKIILEEKISDIYFEKSVGWKEVPHYFSLADVLVLPSYSETWGLVVNEAMICGLPIIVSKQCGCAKDLINGNGIVIDAYDSYQLQEALEKIAIDYNLRKLMGIKSLEIIKDYEAEKVGKRIITKIEGLTI